MASIRGCWLDVGDERFIGPLSIEQVRRVTKDFAVWRDRHPREPRSAAWWYFCKTWWLLAQEARATVPEPANGK